MRDISNENEDYRYGYEQGQIDSADEVERLRIALSEIAEDEVTHTKLNQRRLCCKFQDIAAKALSSVDDTKEGG